MLIYDLEIEKAIPNKKESPIEGIEYCNGWGDHAGMGISCLCAYDTNTLKYRVFTESNKEAFFDLTKKHKILIGFNNINFDNKVIDATWGFHIGNYCSYDILRKIWRAAGYDENVFNFDTHTGYGLDACCKANFDLEKIGYGGYAPVEWQQGKIGNVIDYCLHDVYLTKLLFEKIMTFGRIIDPKNKDNSLIIDKP